MSLLDQLSNLKDPFTNAFDINVKNKKSLIYEDGSSLSRNETYLQCKEGFDALCVLDKRFIKFGNLYLESEIDKPVMLLLENQIKEIQFNIRQFLFLLTDYLEMKCTLQAIEWLIFHYDAHLHQPEDILIACFPFHERPIFVKFIRLFNLKNKEFSWLKGSSENGRIISSSELSTICLKNSHVLEMVCGWPSRILDVCNNDTQACKRICRIIFILSVNVLEKVILKGSDKIEKHVSPFTRFIYDGYNSKNSDFMSSASIILVYMSHQMELDKKFIRNCIKKMLKSNVLQNYTCLRIVIDIVTSQENFLIGEKLEKIIRAKMDKLIVNDRTIIEKMLSEVNIFEVEAMDVKEEEIENNQINMDLHETPMNAIQVKDSEIIANAIEDFNIDWSASDIEKKLTNLIYSNILIWYNPNNAKINYKIAFELLKLIKKNAKQLKISYQPGGLITHLCATLMSPNSEIRKVTKRIMTKVAKEWPSYSIIETISKGTLSSDHKNLMFGDVGRTLLTEINVICSTDASPTIQKVALEMINAQTMSLVPLLTNVWSLFLQGASVRFGKTFLQEAATSALIAIRESFASIDIKHQNTILDAITSQLDGDHEVLSKVTITLSKLHLSLENFQYLLRDIIGVSTKSNKKVTKKILSRRESKDTRDECIQGNGKYQVLVSLGALNLVSSLSANDQIALIHPLHVIIERVLKNNNNDTNKNDIIYLLTNLMSALLTILSAVESILDPEIKERLIPIINIEDITKCLHIYNDTNLHNLILTVMQKLAKLDLGFEQFPLIFFMNWLGKHILPRDDQHSMNILNSVLELILPVSIKVRQNADDASNGNVKIIASFVKDCIDIPKHRALLLYYNLIKNLSDEGLSALWIQLIYMVVIKGNSEVQSTVNECLIVPLMKKFPKEEQLLSIKKVIYFLSQFIHNPSKKRKLVHEGVSDSPMQKKRKGGSGKETNVEKTTVYTNRQEKEFASVKEHLMITEKNMKSVDLLKTMMTYFLIQLKESQLDMCDVTSDVLTDLISSLFSSMKIITNTPLSQLDVITQNEITVMIREVIEAVGMSMSRINYLELIVNLASNDSDDSVKLKSLELLTNKLSTMSTEMNFGRLDSDLLTICGEIMSLCVKSVTGDSTNNNTWNHSVMCATHLVSIGVFHQESVRSMCSLIYETLLVNLDYSLANPDKSLSYDKVILINVFIQKYVTADNGHSLLPVFKTTLKVLNHYLSQLQLTNGVIESTLAIVHAIVSRVDAETIGWSEFESLSSSLYQLTTVDLKERKLSRSSLMLQKNIRMKLAKMHDTNALLAACERLITSGLARENLTFVSGAISMFGCHLAVLNKRSVKWTEKEEGCGGLWSLVWRMLSVAEDARSWSEDRSEDVRLCEEIAMKALGQLCVMMDYDQLFMTKMGHWSQEEPQDAMTFMTRTGLLYRVLYHVTSTSSVTTSAKVISFVNDSNVIAFGAALLQHLAGDRDQNKKTKKIKNARINNIRWTREEMINGCANQCRLTMESVCLAVCAHLQSEHKADMNLEANDQSGALIAALCGTVTSMDQYITDMDQYVTTTNRCLVPVLVQVAINACADDSLLTPLAAALAKYYTELPSHVHLAVLKTLIRIKEALGATFDSSVRQHVDSFIENCKYHEDETIADMAAEI